MFIGSPPFVPSFCRVLHGPEWGSDSRGALLHLHRGVPWGRGALVQRLRQTGGGEHHDARGATRRLDHLQYPGKKLNVWAPTLQLLPVEPQSQTLLDQPTVDCSRKGYRVQQWKRGPQFLGTVGDTSGKPFPDEAVDMTATCFVSE